MSAEHKRPLFAFFAVALVGVLVLAMAARSDAVRSVVHREVAAIVAGALIDDTSRQDVPDASTESAEEIVPVAASTTAKGRAHHETGRRAGERATPGRHHRAGHTGSEHAGSGRGQAATALGHAGARGRGHGKAPGHTTSHGHATARGHAGARGHGHGRATHGKGHGKSRGQGHHRH